MKLIKRRFHNVNEIEGLDVENPLRIALSDTSLVNYRRRGRCRARVVQATWLLLLAFEKNR
jgi:hypothetical protein